MVERVPDTGVNSHMIVSDSLVCVYLVYSTQDGYTPFIKAAQNGHVRVVELLITAKANVNIQTNVSHIDGVCVHIDCMVECVY